MKGVVLNMCRGAERAERKGSGNVAIQDEYRKLQEFGKTTLQDSLKVCVKNICTLQDVASECIDVGLRVG